MIKTFTGYGIIVFFLPNAIIGTFYTILPYTVRATSHPFHAFHFFFRKRESEPEIIYFLIKEGSLKTMTFRIIQQYSFHA